MTYVHKILDRSTEDWVFNWGYEETQLRAFEKAFRASKIEQRKYKVFKDQETADEWYDSFAPWFYQPKSG